MNKNNRRNFIKTTALSGLFLAFLKPINAISSSPRKKVSTIPEWKQLVDVARWCPTVHNLQPHKLKIISTTEAELHYDATRLLPHGDPKCIFATVAIGIFIEHLSIVASQWNYRVTISEIGDPISTSNSGITYFCKLILEETETKEEINTQWITSRRTSRGKYEGKVLSDVSLEKIKKEADKFDHEFFYSNEEEITDFIIELNQQTLFEDLCNEPVRIELDHLFRYSKEEAEEHKDGLWAKCMGFSGKLMKSVFQKHEKWDDGLRKKVLGNYYQNSFKGTKTIGWFGGEFKNTNDWINAGKMLARNWLVITGENAYIHPFGSLITNEEAYKKINEKLTQPSEGKKIWMLFRAGFSDEPTRSFRLTTDEIIIT